MSIMLPEVIHHSTNSRSEREPDLSRSMAKNIILFWPLELKGKPKNCKARLNSFLDKVPEL
jgi:hypothetical protein